MKKMLFFITVLALLPLGAEVKVATIFANNMVLQRETAVPVWGTAAPSEKITVSFGSQSASTTADADGKWFVKLAPMKADKNNKDLIIKGQNNTITVKNVLVGEVWLCSGQSNMEMPMWTNNPRWRAENGDKDVANGANPLIRITTMRPYGTANLPRTDFPMTWAALDTQNGLSFSATAFYFGQELQKNLDVPIGLVASHWGGTKIEPWTPPEGFNSVPEVADIAFSVNSKLPGTPEYKKANEKVIAIYEKWLADYKKAFAENQPQPILPPLPAEVVPFNSHQQPTMIYNRMIYPFVPFAFRGAIWYQGCANLSNKGAYQFKMQALLNGWREVFKNPDMAFYFVQLAPYNYGGYQDRLPQVWEAQEKFARSNPDNVNMAVINDIGDWGDIHPRDKKNIGKRLSLLALKYTYGKTELKADSPELTDCIFNQDNIVLKFKHVKKWTVKGDEKNFQIADIIGDFVDADVKTDGSNLIISAPGIKNPARIRYMWKKNATGNMFNEAGLPLGGFSRSKTLSKAEFTAALEKSFKHIYTHDIKKATPADGSINYLADNSQQFNGKVKKIAYFVELESAENPDEWAIITLDSFTPDVKKIGVPVQKSQAVFGVKVRNVNVFTNSSKIMNESFIEGNIEFWACNYSPRNKYNVTNANTSKYDFGDSNDNETAGYGCMQIHNFWDSRTVFAYNNFRSGNPDIGFGNSNGTTSDWTFCGSKNITKATLKVYAIFE